LGDKGSGQDAGHKVATFLLHVQAQSSGEVSGAAPEAVVTKFAEVSDIVAGSSGVYDAGFGLAHNLTNVDHREDDRQSQERSMNTAELEKALGNMSQGESMSSSELKKALEELGEEEEVSKEECHPVPDVEKLAAIPEASLEQSSARASAGPGWLMRRLQLQPSVAKH
jgi:Mg-chelatase subunit ChlI